MTLATDARAYPDEEQLDHGGSAERRIGAVIAGSYRLTRHIGSGGSSHVFEAEHVRLGKTFAIKLLRPELDPNRRTAQRFRREARAIARLKNEHIVSVIDCGELDDGTPYLVMELLQGEDLRSLLNREGSLPARRAVPLIIEACRGLSEVHAAGLVHRDLKPENLFITRRSTGEDWCKVLDFGVAKMAASLSTAQGAIVGTLRYMAPEQLEASTTVGPATDVYALGAILYECLCGEPAHPGNTAQEVMYSVMNRAAPDAPLHSAGVPARLISAITSCLAKKQELRPRDATTLLALLGQPEAATLPDVAFFTLSEDETPPHPSQPETRRTCPGSFAWGAGTAVGVMALLWWLSPLTTPRSEPRSTSAQGGGRPFQLASSVSTPAPITAPDEPPPAPPTREARLVTQPTEPARAVRPRSAPALRAAPSSSGASTPRAPVGNFDPSNPYGE